MGNVMFLSAQVHLHVIDAKRVVEEEVYADGTVTPGEQRMLDAMERAEDKARLGRVGGSLALCALTGVDIGPYFDQKVEAYRTNREGID